MSIDNVTTFASEADLMKYRCQQAGKEFQKYYDEGWDCSKSNADKWERDYDLNPYTEKRDYSDTEPAKIWALGFRDATKDSFFKKYNLNEMNKELLAIIDKYGMKIEFDDEYGLPEGKTPEGYRFGLFNYIH